MNEILSWLVPVVLGGLVGAVAWIVRLAMIITVLQKDNESQAKEITRLDNGFTENKIWNREEHEKLFVSRNDLEKAIIGIQSTLNNMDEKIQEILTRERARNGSHE